MMRALRTRRALAVLAGVMGLVMMLGGCDDGDAAVRAVAPPAPWATDLPLVGAPMDDLVVERLGGGVTRLADLRGKVVVMNLWATWCPPCRAEMPALQALADALPADDFAVLGVSVDDNPVFAAEYVRERDLRFAAWIDLGGDVLLPRFGLDALPSTLIIGRQGRVQGVVSGFHDWSSPAVRAALEGLAS